VDAGGGLPNLDMASNAWVTQTGAGGPDFARIPNDPPREPSPARPRRWQTKLAVGSVSDPLEREADRVAERIMCMPAAVAARERNEDKTKGVVAARAASEDAPSGLGNGHPLDHDARSFMEVRFGHDFSNVRVHADLPAARSAHALGALAYAVGPHIAFAAGQYRPSGAEGRELLAHELTHVVQQSRGGVGAGIVARNGSGSSPVGPITSATPGAQRRAAPYIKKVTVHLTPPETAELSWDGAPPPEATGSDSFTVSTGKGYSDPGDPRGTCKRDCCTDASTQCAPPHNKPGEVGACCTYVGNSFWTGTPLLQHNGWNWWTPIQPYYGSRGIALHGHPEVNGKPIGHGCVRMDEPNAQRIFDFSNGARTNVTIDGTASPVLCAAERSCAAKGASLDGTGQPDIQVAEAEVVPGQEGELS